MHRHLNSNFVLLCALSTLMIYLFAVNGVNSQTGHDPFEIGDHRQSYKYEWKVNGQVCANTRPLYIDRPFLRFNSLLLTVVFSIYDASNDKLVISREFKVQPYTPKFEADITSVNGTFPPSFRIAQPVSPYDMEKGCQVGIVEEKVSSLKELIQFTNYKMYDIPCNSVSIVQAPYFGVPYTKFLLTFENNRSTIAKQQVESIQYFPNYFVNFGNGTNLSVKDDTLIFSSYIHSNMPNAHVKAQLKIGEQVTTLFDSQVSFDFVNGNGTYFLRFSYQIPPHGAISMASLDFEFSNEGFFFTESESFDIEIDSCSLACENGGICLKDSNKKEYCQCPDLLVGKLCQNCLNGFMKEFNKCVCPKGYEQIGKTCEKGNDGTCYGKNRDDSSVCNGNGQCVSFNDCVCEPGYEGHDCALPICFGKAMNSACSGNGECIAPDTCHCNATFGGIECETPICNGLFESDGGCSFHGTCNPKTHLCECNGNFVGEECSTCKTGFTGLNCDIPICYGIGSIDLNVCSGNGECIEPNKCHCHDDYFGSNCAGFKCNGIDKSSSFVCSSNGHCTAPNICECETNFDPESFCSTCLPSFNGTDCSVKTCNADTTCNGNGYCNEESNCVCHGKFTGVNCEDCIDGWVGANCDFQCQAKTTCSGRGTCSNTGSCICSSTSSGKNCENCKEGWYGDLCDFRVDLNSFEFSENADMIFATVQSSLKKKIDCFSLIVNTEVLGQNPTCILNGDKSLLTIQLGPIATIVIGGNLNVRTHVGSSFANNAKVLGTYYKKVNPIASLTSETSVIACGNMFLDASASSSADRRRLLFTYSVISSPDHQSMNLLNSILSLTTLGSVKFPVDKLTAGNYRIQVVVQSSFSGSISSASFLSLLKNGLSNTAKVGQPLVISPIVSFPSCYKGTRSISNLKFTYSQLDGPKISELYQKDDLLIFNTENTKQIHEGEYSFQLKAQEEGYPEAIITFSLTVTTEPLKVSFNIRDLTQSFEDAINFSITKQDPSYPNENDNVKLSCLNMETLDKCTGFTDGLNIDQSTLTFNQRFKPGHYLFTATYVKGMRLATDRIKITVNNQPKSSLLRAFINIPPNVDLSAVNPSTDLILQVQSLDSLSSERIYLWSTNFDSSEIEEFSKKYFIIPKSSLTPGASHKVSVKVSDGIKEGEASISFIVNSPPTMGVLEINPTQGVALMDEFKISCGIGWSTAQLPLTFKYMFRTKGENLWRLLKDRSGVRSFSTILPSGQLEIKVIVFDSQGSSTETIQNVLVTNPVDISAAIRSLNAIGSSSPDSALRVLQSLNPQTNEAKSQLSEIGSNIVMSYFNQIEKEENYTSQTVSSTRLSISAMSSISNSIVKLPISTINLVVSKFKSTVETAYSKLILSDEDVDSSLNSASTILSYMLNNLAARSISLFTREQVKKMDQVKETLIKLKLKNYIVDMPAIRTSGSDYHAYIRLLSTSSMSGLEDAINSISSFKLAKSFSKWSQIASLETVKIESKVSQHTASVSKLFTFNLISANNEPISISESSEPLARVTLENNEGIFSNYDTFYECRQLRNGELVFSSTCTVTSSEVATRFDIEISSTGSFAVVAKKDYNVIVETDADQLKYLGLLTIIPLIAAVVIVSVIVGVVCVKRRRKQRLATEKNTATVAWLPAETQIETQYYLTSETAPLNNV